MFKECHKKIKFQSGVLRTQEFKEIKNTFFFIKANKFLNKLIKNFIH